jgi:hypothetical protein
MAKRSRKRKVNGDRAAWKEINAGAVVRQSSSWLSRDWILGLILLLAVVPAYLPVMWAGYVWDDDVMFAANPVIVGPLGLREIWTTNAADICPLTLTAFWVEHALWGSAPLPYHLVNVFQQGVCAICGCRARGWARRCGRSTR